MQFDFYHAQIVGGDLLYRLEKYLAVVGHLQCAAVPTAARAGRGRDQLPGLFAAVDRLGYTGWIGAEYRPRGRYRWPAWAGRGPMAWFRVNQ